MKDLLEPYKTKRKISDILEQNSNVNIQLPEKTKEPGPIRNVLGGLFSGLVTTPIGVAGLVEAIPTAGYNLTKAAFSDKYDTKDALMDTLVNNKSFKAASFVDDKIRDVMGLKRFEDLSGGEQLASLTGELIPLIATGGATGITKLSNKAAQKAAIRLAKKKAVKSGKALSSSSIQKAKNTADNAVNMLLPGVQITKNAPTKQKILEFGLQTGIPLGINETIRYASDQEGIIGDYRKKDDTKFSLIHDKRKIKGKTFVDEVAPGVISDHILDAKATINREKANTLKNSALIAGGLLGSVAATRKLRKLFGKEIDSIKQTTPKTNDVIDTLDARTKADMTLADRFAFKKSYVDRGLLSEETANRLAQDVRSKINKAFETGNLYDGIQLSFSPQSTYNKLNTLRLQDPTAYKNVEDFLEISSNIQDETHRYNKNLMKGETDLSPEDYVKYRIENKDNAQFSQHFTTKEDLFNKIKLRKELLQNIDKNPVTKQILSEISQIGDALLKKMEQSKMWSQADIDILRKNRTFGGIFTYKPRILKTKPTIRERLWNYLFEKTPFDKTKVASDDMRGITPIENVYSYLDVFERNFKQTMQEIEDNTIKRSAIKEMLDKSIGKVNTILDTHKINYERLANTSNTYMQENIIALEKQTDREIDKMFSIRPLGVKNIETHKITANKSFFDILNRSDVKETTWTRGLNEKYTQSPDRFAKWEKDTKNVISYIENGKEYFYHVDSYIKSAFDLNTTLPSMLAYHMKSLKNLVQTTITGKLNPAFSIPSAIMATHEALTLLPKLAKELNLSPDLISRWGYIKEFRNAYNNIYSNEITKQILNQYDKVLVKGMENSSLAQKLALINIEEVKARLNSSLLTQIQQMGGASSRPLNTNSGVMYELKKNTVITDKLEKFLLEHDSIDATVQKLNLINFLQNSIRETPSIALTQYLGKQIGAIDGNNVVNLKKMQKVIDTVGTYTANIGRSGISSGTLGSLFRSIENYVPYGNVMIKSLAPKIRASKIDKGFENIIHLVQDLYNPNVRYVDILQNMHRYSTDLLKNKFFEGLIVTSMMPSLVQYVWNHGSEENRRTYYQLSDYDKASKFILVNFFGNGRPLSLPKDQEVALADNIFTTLLDSVVGMSKYNEVDPAFKQSKLIMQSLARSIGIDSVPLIDIVANSQGYDVNFNMFSDKPLVSGLSRNKINQDLSETAYENGLVNQETTALVNSLFGIVGSTLLGSFEEANVGARNDTGINDFGQRLFEGMTKSAKIGGKKYISSYNQTSKTVYNKQNLINKIASVTNKTPQQEQVYETIKAYKRNRIKPIHDMITDIRQSINTVRANGRMADGTLLDFNGRKAKISELNEQLQQLFAQEYQEFNNLDNLLEQMYGNGITLENFMEKLQ